MLGGKTGILIDELQYDGLLETIRILQEEVDIDTVILHPEETSDVMWATMDTIRQLINNNDFINAGRVPYVEELFQMCE